LRCGAVLRQPQSAAAKEGLAAVDQFFRRVARIDHALTWTTERGLDLGDPLLGLIGGHRVAAIILPVEAEQLVGIGRGKLHEILHLRIDISRFGEMVSTPPQARRFRRVLLIDIGRIGVVGALRGLVDHADDAVVLTAL
jgi:hypothetical protein